MGLLDKIKGLSGAVKDITSNKEVKDALGQITSSFKGDKKEEKK